MCLTRLSYVPQLRQTYWKGEGWKVFNIVHDMNGKNYLQYVSQPYIGSYQVQTDNWLETNPECLVTIDNWNRWRRFRRKYVPGFHIYLTKPDMEKYPDPTWKQCVKVYWEDAIVTGYQGNFPCVITKRMLVPKTLIKLQKVAA